MYGGEHGEHTHTSGRVISELVNTRPVIDQQGIAGDRLDIKVPMQAYTHTHTHTLSHEAVESRSETAEPGVCLMEDINNISRFFIHFTHSLQSSSFRNTTSLLLDVLFRQGCSSASFCSLTLKEHPNILVTYFLFSDPE